VKNLPTGTVTFLFTDIEGSTTLLQRLGDRRYAEVLEEHRRLLRDAFLERHGHEVDTQGDAFLVVFPRARDALAAAVAAQRALIKHGWPDDAPLRVRMGLHTGEPVSGSGDYVGLDVHRAARICAAGHGSQILVSDAVGVLAARDLPPGVSLRDLGAHRLKDLKEPEHLLQVIHPDLPSDFPPLKSLSVLANNLPRQLTSFIGRKREMAEVKRLLSTARLVTLTGAGGSGKTRLALQVASEALEDYANGVWLVELASLSDPALVLQAVASALGIREISGRSLDATLLESLQSKEILLVIDNCEHVVEACARLIVSILQVAPDLRVLATSRESLGVSGETVWRVPSLSVPSRNTSAAQELVEYESVRLFIERAAAIQPSFALTPENGRAIVDVCRRLDGIPLAIELAAARVLALSVEEIARRLDDRFRLLTRGDRTALPRHQTLRAAVDSSYQLLSDQERTVWRRLSVFAGGWTLEAAETISQCNGDEGLNILDLLTQLVSKSIVVFDERFGGMRYRFLETIARYGRDRLAESGEAYAIQKQHLHWFLRLAEQAESELVGAQQVLWLERLEAEHDNVRAAIDWALASGEVEDGLRLAGAMWRFWFIHGYFAEGRRWLEALLRTGPLVKAAVRAKALLGAGNLAAFGQGDYQVARSCYEASLSLSRQADDARSVAFLLNSLGFVAAGQGDHAAARTLYEESLTIRRKLKDTWGIANSLHNLGRVVQRQGDYAAADALLRESLAIWRELGDKQNIAMALVNLGFVACNRGVAPDSARAFIEESLAIRQELGDKRGIAYALEGFAWLAAQQGQARRAAQLFGAAQALRETLGAPLPPADRPLYDRMVNMAQLRIGEDDFSAAWAEGRAMTLEQAVSRAKTSEKPPLEKETVESTRDFRE